MNKKIKFRHVLRRLVTVIFCVVSVFSFPIEMILGFFNWILFGEFREPFLIQYLEDGIFIDDYGKIKNK